MLNQNQIETNKKEFISLMEKAASLNDKKANGIKKLLDYLENSDFYTAPASTKYHQNYEGGLCEHSLGVYKHLIKLLEAYNLKDKYSEYSIIIVALLHDLCKIGIYEKVRKKVAKVDANGKEILGENGFKIWEFQEVWETRKDLVTLGHASKTIYMIMHFFILSEEEAEAIYNHMSWFDVSDFHTISMVSNSFIKNKLAYFLSLADLNDTYLG